MNPVCVQCGREMKPERNGFKVELMQDKEKTLPYQIWDTDKFKCPECGIEIATGFGTGPLYNHFDPDYKDVKVDLKYY